MQQSNDYKTKGKLKDRHTDKHILLALIGTPRRLFFNLLIFLAIRFWSRELGPNSSVSL